MDSTPPTTAVFASPNIIAETPLMRACIALAHAQWMVKEGTSGGIAEVIEAILAILGFSGANVFPKMTLSTLSFGKPERSSVALISGTIRSTGLSDLKPPPKSPIAVLCAPTIKTSLIASLLLTIRGIGNMDHSFL
jgi:hypothetical protein